MTSLSALSPNALIRRISIRLGGSQAKELERFIKFFIVGAVGFVVDFGTLNLLQLTVLPAESRGHVIVATSISFTAAITSNFIWNRYWTYPDSRSRSVRLQVIQFFVVNIAGWLVRFVIIVLLYDLLGLAAVSVIQQLSPETVISADAQGQIGSNLAQAVAVFIVMFWNFFVNRYWTYNDVE